MILVYGAKGNMGRRYLTILNHIGAEAFGVDLDTDPESIPHDRASGYIIATPTDTHIRLMQALLPQGRPILCEKPWTKDVHELVAFVSGLDSDEIARLSMVAQYRHLLSDSTAEGESIYDYYRHGSDGLAWDCIQIVALANGPVTLKEQSPVWNCKINGQRLSLADMDRAYIADVVDWLAGARLGMDFILSAHLKTAKLEQDHAAATA